MPNWVYSSVLVSGSKEDLVAFIEKACSGYEILEGDASVAEEKRVSLLEAGKHGEGYLTFGSCVEIPEDFAYNWYDQGLRLFGTKWDLREDETAKDYLLENVFQFSGVHTLDFRIETAWSFPTEGVEAWSKVAPNLLFTFTVEEEGSFFRGAVVAKNGEVMVDFYEPEEVLEERGIVSPHDDADGDQWNEFWEYTSEIYCEETEKRLDRLVDIVEGVA